MEDELMLTRARTMYNNLATDLVDFGPLFPGIDPIFLTSFDTDINTATAFPRDNVVMSNIKVLTADVNASVAEGFRALDALDIYAQLAYKDSPAKQRVFGQDTWQKARNDQEKMVFALQHAREFANQNPYKADLIAKGYTQANIDSLETIRASIVLKNGLQEKAKSGRPVTTQDRILVYNVVWERMTTVATCALLVYRDNAAKLEQYRLYPPGTTVTTTVIVHVTRLAIPVQGATVHLKNTTIASGETGTDGNVSFESGDMPATVDVEVTHPLHSPITLNDQPVLNGAVTVIEAQFV